MLAMILFLDRVPFLSMSPAARVEDQPWVIPIPVVATESSRQPPRRPAQFYPWLLDTAYTGSAHVWQSDLRLIGLDPQRPMQPRPHATRSAYGAHSINQQRYAALWLFSNLPSMFDRPLLLPIGSGLEVHVPAAPIARRGGLGLPLIGTRLLIRAGLRADIDYGRQCLSAWIPAPWLTSRLQFSLRLARGFARSPVAWHKRT